MAKMNTRAHFADVELAQHDGSDQNDHDQQAIPEPVPVVTPQRDVLLVIGAEQIAHRSDPLSHAFREQSLRPDEQHQQQDDVGRDLLESGG